MPLRLHWLITLCILAACTANQQLTLPTYVPWPDEVTSTAQAVAMNELIEPASIDFNEVIAPATFAATSIPSLGELTLPPSFTPTFTPSSTMTPGLTATPTATATFIPSATATALPPTATPFLIPTDFPEHEEAVYSKITYDEARALLFETPLLLIPEKHIRQIYARGQGRGLNEDFLLSVGDCNSESHWYLQSLLDDAPPQGDGVDINYYQDISIQSTIDYYSDAFAFKGQAVNSGLNAMSVLDPFWANPNLCAPGASPLACDYQQTQPFASVIMFGANDIKVLNTAGYELALREIIEFTLERDIVPILSTFTVRPMSDGKFEQGTRFNGIVVHLADEYNIPLMNFWLAARDVDGYGILEDNAHLTVPGFNIRNRLTLDMLNTLRHDVLMIEDET
jgi:hypothetical protein